METAQLISVFSKFDEASNFKSFQELASGHINDTYLIETVQQPKFVLQRINHGVFKDVPGLIENKVSVSIHIQEKFKALGKAGEKKEVLRFVRTKEGKSYYQSENGDYWNLMLFIEDSVTFETVHDPEIAYEGGKLFGEFLNLTDDFDASKLTEVIPKFHDMSFRFQQFDAALLNASSDRVKQAETLISKVKAFKEEMHILQNLKDNGAIKIRVTHNDTKISNALFTKENKGLCVIDTDTIMPGIVHYDFGDAIRTICNSAAEDEQNLELVTFNVAYYKAYLKGFLEKTGSALSAIELRYLPLGAKSMIFIMAIRFLTDFLNNDVYYKTKYENHNLVRAKNQFKLIASMEEQMNQIQEKHE
ncbi:phosphotransferase enzyme family protein [Flavicella sediminum]|uniref:phosphotransferase enzyme family protein n=1 Tax=Flavicella sediminum TaxID=2585141 RepID=UPI00111CD03D|nr:aminoglycoside phosphotransferase family protein [Flavicella sediminum]